MVLPNITEQCLTAGMMGVNDQSVGECKVSPAVEHLTQSVGFFEFMSDRCSNFSDNNLFVPILKLSFQDIDNEESDLTCQFMPLKQNEALHPLRSLTWTPGSLQLERGAETLGWAEHFVLYSPRRASKTAHGLARLLCLPVQGSQGQER